MLRTISIMALCAFAILLPAVAHADAYSDLEAMHNAFTALTSWHAVEQLPDGRTNTVDYVAPDRWKIVNPSMTEILDGDRVYMIRGTHTTAMPSFMGGMIRKAVDNFRLAPYDAGVKASARDLGMKVVNGQRVHAYSYTSGGSQVTMYVGANHLPVQSQVQMKNGTMTISYSAFNAPIAISP